MSAVEEAKGYKSLIDIYGFTQEKVSSSVGKSRSYVANTLRLLNLPKSVIERLENNEISVGHARTLLSLENEEDIEQVDPKEFFTIEDPDMDSTQLAAMNEAYTAIDRKARYTLSNNYAITITDDNVYFAFAITYVFILNIFRKLLQDLGDNPTKTLSSVNFNDNIEFHAMRDDEGFVKLAMRPGLNAKLLIKSDETTEEDDLDDEVSWM